MSNSFYDCIERENANDKRITRHTIKTVAKKKEDLRRNNWLKK